MLLRPLRLLALWIFSAATAAQAQSSSLPIAYVKMEGSSASIYVTNETGVGTTKVYSAPSKATLTALDIRPGHQELAFLERRSGKTELKILTYANDATTISVRTLAGPCAPSGVDYHPTRPELLLTDTCNQQSSVRAIGLDGTGLTTLAGPIDGWIGQARWLFDGANFIYPREIDAQSYGLCRNSCSGPADILWTGTSSITWMDVARTENIIIYNQSAGTDILRYNIDSGQPVAGSIRGTDGHFSPDDSKVVFETPHHAKGNYLVVRNSNGSEIRISGKGDFGPKDWRK